MTLNLLRFLGLIFTVLVLSIPNTSSAQFCSGSCPPYWTGSEWVSVEPATPVRDACKAAGVELPSDGISSDWLCGVVSDKLGGGLLGTLAGIGSFFGVCSDPSDRMAAQIAAGLSTAYDLLEQICLSGNDTSVTHSTVNGEPVIITRVVECTFTPPNVPPTCAGAVQLCEMFGLRSVHDPRDPRDPAGVFRSTFQVPGCTCTTSESMTSRTQSTLLYAISED